MTWCGVFYNCWSTGVQPAIPINAPLLEVLEIEADLPFEADKLLETARTFVNKETRRVPLLKTYGITMTGDRSCLCNAFDRVDVRILI